MLVKNANLLLLAYFLTVCGGRAIAPPIRWSSTPRQSAVGSGLPRQRRGATVKLRVGGSSISP